MKKLSLAIVSPYPPSKGTLNEYAYHLVNHFKNKDEISEIVILSDRLPEGQSFPEIEGKVKVTVMEAWDFNNFTNCLSIRKAIQKIKPDVVLFNIQFLSFGDNKVAATLGLLTPLLVKLSGTPTVSLLHNILETVDLKSSGTFIF